jgi:hypothetical protein
MKKLTEEQRKSVQVIADEQYRQLDQAMSIIRLNMEYMLLCNAKDDIRLYPTDMSNILESVLNKIDDVGSFLCEVATNGDHILES